MRLIGLASRLVTQKNALSFPLPLVIGIDIAVRVQRYFTLFHVFVFCAYTTHQGTYGRRKEKSLISLSVSGG
jgi:hypothetical protein